MSALVDTNVLLRRIQIGHEHQALAIKSVRHLIETGEATYYTLQNISEFWNVMTRPIANNGLGFSVALTLREIEKIESVLTILPDTADIYAEWKRLVVKYNVTVVKVHDARLVAIMSIYQIDRILTFNTNDFTRFGIGVIHPASVV